MVDSPVTKARERLWPYVLATLLLPAVVLWRGDNPLFPRSGLIDTWVYLGLFRNLVNFKAILFPDLYYGSRLSWLLPGALINGIFSPVPAYYVLHLTFYSIATISFLLILRRFISLRSAFLATLIFAVNPTLWYSMGTDYVDGGGVAYCLLTIALLTRAASACGPDWKMSGSLLASGLALGALVYTNLFWAAFSPLFLLYYAVLTKAWRGVGIVRSIISFCIGAGSGLAIVTVILGAINYRIDGDFWFYAPSLRFIRALNPEKNPWFTGVFAPEGPWPWLWITAFAALLSIPLIVIWLRHRQPQIIFPVLLLVALGLMGYLQERGTPVFGLIYYASYLIPLTFLTIGGALWRAADNLTAPVYVTICCLALAGMAAIWADEAGRYTPVWPGSIRATALAATIVLALAMILRHRVAGMLLALLGCSILTAEMRYRPPQYPLRSHVLQPADSRGYRHDYQRIMRASEQIESARQGHRVKFWYDDNESAFLDYRSLNSIYHYEYSRLGAHPEQRACENEAEPGDLVVVLSSTEAIPNAARAALAGCWAKFAVSPAALPSSSFVTGDGIPWTMTIIQASTGASVRHPLSAEFQLTGDAAAMLPLERWKEYVDANARSAIHRLPEGFELHTADAQYAWGAMYPPLMAPVTGRYRFTLRYKLEAGQFAFGIFAGDSSHWLAVARDGRALRGGDREMSVWLDLQEGDRVQPRIENNNATGNYPATLVMKQMTALEIDR